MDWRLIVPGETGWDAVNWTEAREVRLRPGQGAAVTLRDGVWHGQCVLSPQEILQAAQALTGHALAARQEELSRGFVPLKGGHRLGVCGVMGPKGFREITSLCVRLAHEIKGVGKEVYPLLQDASALIIGPPGAGKTTLLRDLIRLYGEHGVQVGVADERGEIAACRDGTPQLDVGPAADVAGGRDKASAMILLIRAMAPQVIATDELGGPRDAWAVQAAIRCGVTVLATAHGRSRADVRKRLGPLDGAFERLVILEKIGQPPRVEALDGGEAAP